MWKVRATVAPVVIRELRAVTPQTGKVIFAECGFALSCQNRQGFLQKNMSVWQNMQAELFLSLLNGIFYERLLPFCLSISLSGS